MDLLEIARNAINEIGAVDFIATDKLESFSLLAIACSTLVIAEELRKMNKEGVYVRNVSHPIIRKVEE